MTHAAEQDGPYAFITDSFNALITAIMAPAGDPISPPTPRLKPKPALTEKPAPAKKPKAEPGVVAQCGPATILSAFASDGETLEYRATFAQNMINTMVEEGCGQFYQGCNICSVRYDGCEPEDKALCKTSACLERTCTRRVVCSSKICRTRGKEPTCESRMARTSCRKPLFE